MNLQPSEVVNLIFQFIAFLFAISIHESAHAWMANRCGDPTARMLGRITLNPIKHIDWIGTVLLPIGLGYASLHLPSGTSLPIVGWAKPTPVDPRNFKNPVKDDILTAIAGPISNFFVAFAAVIVLLVVSGSSPLGNFLVRSAAAHALEFTQNLSTSFLVPLTLLVYDLILINVALAVFNLIPIPPLDGSHVLRHFLSDSARRTYDRMGLLALFALVFFGGGLLWRVMAPVQGFFDWMLTRI